MQGYSPMTPEQRRQDDWVAKNINKPKRWHGSTVWDDYKRPDSTVKYYATHPNAHFEIGESAS